MFKTSFHFVQRTLLLLCVSPFCYFRSHMFSHVYLLKLFLYFLHSTFLRFPPFLISLVLHVCFTSATFYFYFEQCLQFFTFIYLSMFINRFYLFSLFYCVCHFYIFLQFKVGFTVHICLPFCIC